MWRGFQAKENSALRGLIRKALHLCLHKHQVLSHGINVILETGKVYHGFLLISIWDIYQKSLFFVWAEFSFRSVYIDVR